MSKIDLIRYKALDRGWTKADYKRVCKKIEELAKEFDGGSIMFKDIEELAMMLDEAIDYKLEFSLVRMSLEERIFLSKAGKAKEYYILEIRKF